MTKGEKLLKDTILYGIAHFGSKILAFLAIPLYTHYFTTAEYGTWDIYQVTIALLVPFITFELTAATYRWLIEEKRNNERQIIITTGILTIVRNLVIFNVIGAVIIYIVSIPYSWLALLLINLEIINSFLQQCARALGHLKLFASIGFVQTFIMISSLLLFMYIYHWRVEAFFYATIIASLIVIIITAISLNIFKYISTVTFSKSTKRDFLNYSLPIIPGAASWWIMTMSDRYFITIFLGLEANGIFAIANKVPAIVLMLNTIFFLAWKDNAILNYDSTDKNSYYSVIFKHFFRLMTTTIIILILIAKPVIGLVIATDFYNAWKYTGILLVGALLHTFALFWTAGYHGAKATGQIFISSMVGAIVNIVVNLLLIQVIGLYAVAISTIIAFLTVWIMRIRASAPHFRIELPWGDVLGLGLSVTMVLVLSFVLTPKSTLIILGLSIVFFVTVNWRLFFYMWQRYQLSIRSRN